MKISIVTLLFNGQITGQNSIIEVLGENFYNELLDIKDKIKLDRTLFGYYDRCFIVNEVLSNHNFLIKFFKRRDKFFSKNQAVKNEVTRNLLSSVIEKFNGYENIKQKLACKEKVDFPPLDTVYEPTFDKNVPVPCFFTSQIFLAYRSYFGRFKMGEEKISHRTVKQCHYCENFFAKTNENMKKHLSVCSAKGGITYTFDNGQIVNFQDNFKYLGDVPFMAYFDFETTTGNSAF